MRQLLIGTLIPAYMVVSGCSERGNAQPFALRQTVVAGAVESPTIDQRKFYPPGGRYLHGQFTIRAALAGERGIVSSSSGGACLIAQFPGADKKCVQDSECDRTVDAGTPGERSWHGYCVDSGIHTGIPTGKCWVKPSDDYCKKPAGLGTHYTPFVDVTEVYQQAKGKPVTWRVLGCLNGATVDGSRPCAAGEKMLAAGQTKTLP